MCISLIQDITDGTASLMITSTVVITVSCSKQNYSLARDRAPPHNRGLFLPGLFTRADAASSMSIFGSQIFFCYYMESSLWLFIAFVLAMLVSENV